MRLGFAQGFVNLDFEAANLSAYGAGPAVVPITNAIPGWTAVGTPSANDILYNDVSLGSPTVSLVGINNQFDPSSLDGSFSVVLQAFFTGGASISQTALVPVSAESLLFEAKQGGAGTLQVSLGGQNLSYSVLSSGANYTLYGANISAYAGQTEQLAFSALAVVSGGNIWNIDDIQFSSSTVPEPSDFALVALGALLLGFRRWRNK